MFKIVFASCLVATAFAGGPAAYDIATATGDQSSIGYSQESTQKGYAGQNVVSSYTRQENTPYSSVHVSNSRVSNDLIPNGQFSYASPVKQYAATGYSYPAAASPIVQKTVYAESQTHAAAGYAAGYAVQTPVAAPIAAPVLKSYVAPVAAPVLKSYAAPAVAYNAPAAPAIAYSAPAIAYSQPATPAIAYGAPAAAPALAYGAPAAPAIAYGAPAAPAIAYGAPAAPGISYGAPAIAYGAPATPALISKPLLSTPALQYSSPIFAKQVYSAPIAASYAATTLHAAPIISKTVLSAPQLQATPVLATAKYSTPVYSYSAQSAPLLTKTYAAPSYYAEPASPILKTYAPSVTPIIKSYAAPAPIYAKAALTTQYAAAAPIVHATFSGYGTSYSW